MRIELKHGLDIRLPGAPMQRMDGTVDTTRIAILPADYRDLRPALAVESGERVAAGQRVFNDRRIPALACTSPVSGIVTSIHRGSKRRIQEIVIERDGNAEITFPSYSTAAVCKLSADDIRQNLLASGLWLSLRTRPFDRAASPDDRPRALLVTAIDTNPLAPDPAVMLHDNADAFVAGVKLLARLCTGTTFVCVAAGTSIPVPEAEHIRRVELTGPHPAGLPGTHIHALGLEVRREADLWHAGYQDVVDVGQLFLVGRVPARRVIAVAGPCARRPRLVSTLPGADLGEFAAEWSEADGKLVSGSLLAGRGPARFLGRFDNQVTMLPSTGVGDYRRQSLLARLAAFFRGTNGHAAVSSIGAAGGMLPSESFEGIWPFHVPPMPLLRALLSEDAEQAEQFGCLGLAEEDLALCTYICASRNDYGAALRAALNAIERDG
ncbi:MAG: NADH:ubiquinone reductase (Na(+)-transporting) subunit A [Woeseia sp.]